MAMVHVANRQTLSPCEYTRCSLQRLRCPCRQSGPCPRACVNSPSARAEGILPTYSTVIFTTVPTAYSIKRCSHSQRLFYQLRPQPALLTQRQKDSESFPAQLPIPGRGPQNGPGLASCFSTTTGWWVGAAFLQSRFETHAPPWSLGGRVTRASGVEPFYFLPSSTWCQVSSYLGAWVVSLSVHSLTVRT